MKFKEILNVNILDVKKHMVVKILKINILKKNIPNIGQKFVKKNNSKKYEINNNFD